MSKPHIIVDGMQGLGDNIHQRAIVRALMDRYVVWLKTPWPSVYEDLARKNLRLLRKPTVLRTQRKNQLREAAMYSSEQPPVGCDVLTVSYSHDGVRKLGSFVRAMAYQSNVLSRPRVSDFALPIPPAWRAKAQALLDLWRPTKPIMIYRPLVERKEWAGNAPRNPDPAAYVGLAKSVIGDFFSITLADLSPNEEWAVSAPIDTHVTLANGELDFETMAALFSMSDLVFTAPGFGLILAQAVGTRLVAVFGGHESARFYDHGSDHEHFIQPTNPCECFRKDHNCDKSIPFSAKQHLKAFLADEQISQEVQ